MPESLPTERAAETRKLAAIMFTDMVGFSRQMGSDEARTLRLLAIHNQIIEQALAPHHGHVIKTFGDAFLVDFPSVVHAVQCAQHIQAQFRTHNAEQDQAEQIHIRIGIHLGDMVVQPNGDVLGDGVNIASRLQDLAEPDTICISDMVYRDVAQKLSLGTVISLGRPKLKNIAQRFPVYALLPEKPKGLQQHLQVQRLKLFRRVGSTHLRWAVAGLLLITGTVVAVRYLFPPIPNTQHLTPSTQAAPAALPLPDKPSIVVLPFVNMSEDPKQEYFSDGLTEVLTGDLSKISSLFVIARNSAFTYKGKAVKVQDVGREMGVHYVLEGSVLKAEGQIRITAQLIDTTTGYHLWAERYDRPLKDIFALQDEIVQKIVTTLGLQLSVQEQGYSVRKHTDNLEAYDSLLRGIEPFFRFTQETNTQARQLFEKAVALDPQYAEAYAYLGWTYIREWALGWNTAPETLERALVLEQQAIALDDSLSRAHALLGLVYGDKQQPDQAIAEGERAIALDPNNDLNYFLRADILNLAGRPEDALRMAEQALRLNPHYPPVYLFPLGGAYFWTGRYAEAVATLQDSISRSPSNLVVHVVLAFSYLYQWAFQQGADAQTLTQAMAAAQRIITLNDAYAGGHLVLGYVSLWQKQYEPAIAEMERAIALAPTLAEGYAGLAEVLSRVGRPEDAVGMAEQALRRKPLVADEHLYSVGTAYDLAWRPEEAITPLRQYLSHYPNILGAHLILAAVYSELGKEMEARAEVTEVLRLKPQFSLEVHRERVPIKDLAVLERHLAALRKAGLK
ncbi:MAG: tetratricopeptide repeat protein [Deltaproteobacteria bacterium]|nr:tetratricopeptide repeat protein [Deltaproteobacteria bacterium]